MAAEIHETPWDDEPRSVVTSCEQETAIQLKWLRTRMKQAAPQTVVVAE